MRFNPLYLRATSPCQLTAGHRRLGSCPLTAEGRQFFASSFLFAFQSYASPIGARRTVSDVRDPGLVRSCYVELPVELIIDDDRRSAAIDAGTAFVADLRLYSGETRQARDPVRAAQPPDSPAP